MLVPYLLSQGSWILTTLLREMYACSFFYVALYYFDVVLFKLTNKLNWKLLLAFLSVLPVFFFFSFFAVLANLFQYKLMHGAHYSL